MNSAPSIYLAAAYPARDRLRSYAATLVRAGFQVTSTWLGETSPLDAPVSAQPDCVNAHLARLALRDIDAADHLVAFTERTPAPARLARGGRHVELGYALAQGKTLWTCGPVEHVFHHLVPPGRRLPDWRALLQALRRELQ